MIKTLSLILPDKSRQSVEVELISDDDDCTRLLWNYSGKTEEAKAVDFFECLLQMRQFFEQRNILIACNGARYDVFPSTMVRQMSNGLRAYVMKLGSPATRYDIVEVFDETSDLEKLGTIDQQREYFDRGRKSFKNRS